MDDLISRQATIDAFYKYPNIDWTTLDVLKKINALPSAQPDYQEVLGWLLAYHTKSFDLHGRYFPHEVISMLISDFTKEFIAERENDDNV